MKHDPLKAHTELVKRLELEKRSRKLHSELGIKPESPNRKAKTSGSRKVRKSWKRFSLPDFQEEDQKARRRRKIYFLVGLMHVILIGSFLISVQEQTKPRRPELLRGDQLFLAGRISEAIGSYEMACAENPHDSELQYALAWSVFVSGSRQASQNRSSSIASLNRALTILEEIDSQSDMFPDALSLEARIVLAKGNHDEAVGIYQKIAKLFPDSDAGRNAQRNLQLLAQL